MGETVRVPHKIGKECQLGRLAIGDNVGIVVAHAAPTNIEIHNEGNWHAKSNRGWRFRPPTVNPEPPVPTCAATTSQELTWATPIPVGADLVVKDASADGDCTHLTLVGTSSGSFKWHVCAGPLAFSPGDKLAITRRNDATTEALTIEQISRSEKRTMTLSKHRLGSGSRMSTTPNFSAHGAYNRGAKPTCIAQRKCERAWLPANQVVRFGSNQLHLGRGDQAKMRDTTTSRAIDVRVLRARARFVTPRGCFPDESPTSEFHTISIMSEAIARTRPPTLQRVSGK